MRKNFALAIGLFFTAITTTLLRAGEKGCTKKDVNPKVAFYLSSEKGNDRQSQKYLDESIFFESEPIFDAKDIEKIAETVSKNQFTKQLHRTYSINLNERGKERLAKATRNSTGKRVLIMADGKIVAAVMLQSEIPDGRLQVTTGQLNEKELTLKIFCDL